MIDIRERNTKINDKFNSIDDRIAKVNERKRMQALIHREVENLKLNEVLETKQNKKSARGS